MGLAGRVRGGVSGRGRVDPAARLRGLLADMVILGVVVVLALIMALTTGAAKSRANPRLPASGARATAVRSVAGEHPGYLAGARRIVAPSR